MSTSTRRTVGSGNIVLVVLGGALVVLAMSGLSWYSVDSGADTAGNGFAFGDLRANADQLVAPIASAYFDWLAWALLVAAVVVALAANLPIPGTAVLRVAGFLLGVAGVGATIYALAQLFDAQHTAGGSDHSVFHNAGLGLWASLAGFALLAVGAVRSGRGGD